MEHFYSLKLVFQNNAYWNISRQTKMRHCFSKHYAIFWPQILFVILFPRHMAKRWRASEICLEVKYFKKLKSSFLWTNGSLVQQQKIQNESAKLNEPERHRADCKLHNMAMLKRHFPKEIFDKRWVSCAMWICETNSALPRVFSLTLKMRRLWLICTLKRPFKVNKDINEECLSKAQWCIWFFNM